MKTLSTVFIGFFLYILSINNSYAYPTSYELLGGSSIEINGTVSSLTGSFSFDPGIILLANPLPSLPLGYTINDPISYTLNNISMHGGGQNIISGSFQYEYNFPVNYNHVKSVSSSILQMDEIAIDQSVLESTSTTVTYMNRSLIPLNIFDTDYNLIKYDDPDSFPWPSEILFTYQLTEKVFSGVKVDPLSGVLVQGGWDIQLESTETVGTLSIHAVNTAPVPLPGAAWLFGSGLASLFAMVRQTSNKQITVAAK